MSFIGHTCVNLVLEEFLRFHTGFFLLVNYRRLKSVACEKSNQNNSTDHNLHRYIIAQLLEATASYAIITNAFRVRKLPNGLLFGCQPPCHSSAVFSNPLSRMFNDALTSLMWNVPQLGHVHSLSFNVSFSVFSVPMTKPQS